MNLASCNGQNVTVTLTGVTDTFGQTLPSVSVTFRKLVGDVNGNGAVNASDIAQVKSNSGSPVTAANFRSDVIPNGSINATDISRVKALSGTSLVVPSSPHRDE